MKLRTDLLILLAALALAFAPTVAQLIAIALVILVGLGIAVIFFGGAVGLILESKRPHSKHVNWENGGNPNPKSPK